MDVEQNDTLNKVIWRRLVWATPDASLKDAAELMYKEDVSSVVVMDGDVPIGIITDSDLRKVITDGLDINFKLGEFLKYKPKKVPNLVTAEIHEDIYNVLSKMIEHKIKHAIVIDSGKPIGVVTIGDIAYRLSPFHLHYIIKLRKMKNLEDVKSIIFEFKDELIKKASKFSKEPEVVGAGYFFEAISHVVDTALKTIVDLRGGISKGLLYAATGSWGRREQFLLTDRDTLAIYKESSPRDDVKSFINDLEDRLDEVGFPPCRHGYTARNFIFELNDLLKLIDVWSNDPQKFAVNISLIADARSLIGDNEILEMVKKRLASRLYKNKLLLIQSLIYRPPKSLFGMPRSFDLKSKLIAPIEYPIRALAITNNILSTSTFDRIKSLRKNKIVSDELAQSLLQSYNIIMRFKILVQLDSKPSLDLSSITSVEKEFLKNAIKTIKFLHNYIERTFI